MSTQVANQVINAAAIAATLTPKGREFMRAVGAREFSFFDNGIVEGSGCWSSILSGEHFASPRSASGVMGATAKAGLWTVSEHEGDGPDAGAWWNLTAAGAAVALHLAGKEAPEQPESAPEAAEEPSSAESTSAPAEVAEEAPRTPDATKDWHGNYNTVFVPLADALAASAGVVVWTENALAMLRRTHVAGPGAAEFVARLGELEEQAQTALKVWQKTNAQSRRGLTDMQKYNQHRAFLAGFGQGSAGAKKPATFAKDMEKAMQGAEAALAAGLAAGRAQGAA